MKLAPAILLPFCAGLLTAQQRLTIVLDPARGGSEYGTRIDGHAYEKQVTLDLANRLRSLLNARDFNVVLTREGDTIVSNDARATVANQSKPIACLLLHTTGSGTGLHLFTSSLTATPPGTSAVLWDEAQAPFVQRSQRLSNEFSTAFSRSRIPVSSARTWMRPLDNMQCPAVAIEIAPGADGTKSSDRAYQTRIADAIAGAMLFWRGHQDIVDSIVPPPPPGKAPAEKQQAPEKPAADDAADKKPAAPTVRTPNTTPASPTLRPITPAAQPSMPKSSNAPTQPENLKPRPVVPKPAAPKPVAPKPPVPTPDPDTTPVDGRIVE